MIAKSPPNAVSVFRVFVTVTVVVVVTFLLILVQYDPPVALRPILEYTQQRRQRQRPRAGRGGPPRARRGWGGACRRGAGRPRAEPPGAEAEGGPPLRRPADR